MALRLTYTKGSSPNTARLNAGEAFLMFYKVKDVDLTGRAFVFSVYDAGTYEKSYDAEIINGVAYWIISGAHSTEFYKLGTTLTYDFTERLRDETRETIFTGILTVDRTAAVIKSLATAPLGRVIVGINHSFDPTSSGAPDIAISYEPYVPPVAAPVAPVFTSIPTTLGGTAVGSVRIATDGYVDHGTITGRQWLRNGVAINGATGSIYTLSQDDLGALVSVRVSAVGDGGTITATSASFTVVAAPIVIPPDPDPDPEPILATIYNTYSNSTLLPSQVEGLTELLLACEARIEELETAYAS